ncbi:MAG: hypothetical protein IJQ10_03770 [Clostridia bacterium]|nr:hypothetical protein [Clostridia bacterium]
MSIKNFSKITAVYLLSVFGMLVVNNNNTRVSAMNPSNLSSKPKVSSVSSVSYKPGMSSMTKTVNLRLNDDSESSFEINNDNDVSMKEDMNVENKNLERSNLKELLKAKAVSVGGKEEHKFNKKESKTKEKESKTKEKESEKSVPPSQPMSTGKKVGIVAAIVAGAAALGTGIYALCQKVSRTSSSSRSNITPQINASTNKITNAN